MTSTTKIVGYTLLLICISSRTADGSSFLAGRLAEIAERDTVIVVQATCGYLALTTNCVNWLLKMRIKNFILIAEDEIAYEYLLGAYPNHVVIVSDVLAAPNTTMSGEFANFNSAEFRAITNQRPEIWLNILKLGFNILAIDSDVVLLKNPMTTLPLL